MKSMNHVFKGKKNYARAKFDGCSEGKDHIHNRGKRFIISSFRTVSIAAFLAAVIFLAGCTGSGADSPPASGGSDGDKIIKIGMVGPLTGDYATYGQSVRNGVQTAIDEINAEGGVNGFTLQLIAEDSKGESTEAANAVQKLIDQDKVTAIVGAVLSGETATVAPIAQDSGVLMVTPSSTAPGLTDTGDYIFRNVITDDVQARQLAE
jgi:branched-chain amino acid transport system substrate-binding protein